MIPLQLNGIYYPQEDRIMLRIKTSDQSEYRFWMTRLITLKILSTIEKISMQNISANSQSKALPQSVIETIDDMQQKSIKNQTNLNLPYQGATELPLGGDPLLVTEVSFLTSEPSQITINLTLKNTKSIKFEFNMPALARVRVLLHQLSEKGRWTLNATQEKFQENPSKSHSIH